MARPKVNHDSAVTATIQKLDNLSVIRAAWQKDFDETNNQLYSLLAECLDIYNSIKGEPAEKAILDRIKLELTNADFDLKKHSSVISLIVCYVFGKQNRRLKSYTRAISIALQLDITKDTFAAWVKKFGGIEEVVLKKGLNPEVQEKYNQIKAKTEEVKNVFSNPESQTFFPKSELLDHTDTGEYTLLIGKTLRTGETQVLSVVPNASRSMIDSAIDKIAIAQIELDKKRTYVNFNNQTTQLVNNAVQEAILNQVNTETPLAMAA
jgi:hypothetical protein